MGQAWLLIRRPAAEYSRQVQQLTGPLQATPSSAVSVDAASNGQEQRRRELRIKVSAGSSQLSSQTTGRGRTTTSTRTRCCKVGRAVTVRRRWSCLIANAGQRDGCGRAGQAGCTSRGMTYRRARLRGSCSWVRNCGRGGSVGQRFPVLVGESGSHVPAAARCGDSVGAEGWPARAVLSSLGCDV